MEFQWKERETKRSGNIPQAHLITHESKGNAGIYNANKTQQQKKYPELRDIRQHLHSFTLIPQAPPTSIYTKPKEKKKRVATSLGASSLCATAPRVPPAWGTGLVPARARVAGSCRSGFGPSPLQPRDSSETLSTTQLSTPRKLCHSSEELSVQKLPVCELSVELSVQNLSGPKLNESSL